MTHILLLLLMGILFLGIHVRDGNVLFIVKINIWYHQKLLISWINCCVMITWNASLPAMLWNTLTSVSCRNVNHKIRRRMSNPKHNPMAQHMLSWCIFSINISSCRHSIMTLKIYTSIKKSLFSVYELLLL